MNRVQARLDYIATLHDFLVFASVSGASIEELALALPPRVVATLVHHLQKKKLITLKRSKWNGVLITHICITKRGYVIRGHIEDYWRILPALSAILTWDNKTRQQEQRGHVQPSLLSPFDKRLKIRVDGDIVESEFKIRTPRISATLRPTVGRWSRVARRLPDYHDPAVERILQDAARWSVQHVLSQVKRHEST